MDFALENTFSTLKAFFICILFAIAVFPLVIKCEELISIFSEWLSKKKKFNKQSTCCISKKIFLVCFCIISVFWFAGYLAAFPGIYANDAHTWFMEFDDPNIPISAQWSPIYAFLFYIFVHTGYILSGTYELGLSVFTFLQMLFVLYSVYKVLGYSIEKAGAAGGIAVSIFYTILPTHVIVSVQTAQAAPFMACFALIFLHLAKMNENSELYWKEKKNPIILTMLVLAGSLFRNNGYLAFILFIPLLTFFEKKMNRKNVLICFISALLLASVWNNVILPINGIRNFRATNEILSLPLQQISCVYNKHPERLTGYQRQLVIEYIGEKNLSYYHGNESIADCAKREFDVKRFKEKPMEFFKLYMCIGLQSPKDYVYAFFMLDLSLFYIDKSYPDARTWHPFLNYTSVDFPIGIKIKQKSLFPIYSKYLIKLFGDTVQGFGGVSGASFSKMPFLGIFIRVSTWFWILFFIALISFYKKNKQSGVYISLAWCFLITIMPAPLIMYRYVAPVIFCIPCIVFSALGDGRNKEC